jgi:hypothetical protein
MLRVAVGALVAVSSLALTGCGNQGPGTGGTPSPTSSSGVASGDAVAWADKVCESVRKELGTLNQGPNIDTSNPQATKDGLVRFLSDIATAIDRLVGGLKANGSSTRPPRRSTRPRP